MMPTAEDAWLAYENGNYKLAAELWHVLIQGAASETERREFELGFGYTLVALKEFDEARALYSGLLTETGASVYLHQLGMVEREAGAYNEALRIFELERVRLKEDDLLRRAGNLYEMGLLQGLLGHEKQALSCAEACLELALQTDDFVMHGCAYRLLGDLNRLEHHETINWSYKQAYAAFERAGDTRACAEIKVRQAEKNAN